MEKIVMEDGSEREVPTAEEIADFTAKAERLATLEAEHEATKKQLQEAENPNWKNLRTQAEQMRAKLAEKGVQFDQSGNPLPDGTQVQIKPEEIFNTARNAAKGVLIEDTFNKSISKLDLESQAIVKRHYDKLTAGEVIDASNISSFIEAAMGAAGVNNNSRPAGMPSYGGGEPQPTSAGQVGRKRGIEIAKELGYRAKGDLSKLL